MQSPKKKSTLFDAEISLVKSLRQTKNERMSRTLQRKEHFKGESREEKLEKFREFRYDSKAEREMRRRGMAADMRSEISTMTQKLKGNIEIKVTPSELLGNMNTNRESRQRKCEEKLENDVSDEDKRLRSNVESACSELRSNLDDIKSQIEGIFERFGDGDRLASFPVSKVMDRYASQDKMHSEDRLQTLTQLSKLSIPTMTQKSVSAVKSKLETLQDAESELAENFKSDLTNLHETFVKEAQTMLEKMRCFRNCHVISFGME
eukprot:g6043.t1